MEGLRLRVQDIDFDKMKLRYTAEREQKIVKLCCRYR